ncbi:DUF3786 domain-containing protein [Clostridium sp. P21]|uniref:DUF3786 domain-containing protein n=1 Tax=Clostridium muellerianum TaxID=2716538 RepID=A0A7Y0EHV9_9CLOT|nr:DUF3786 domain-containing protein [Clostridium muellerianum]NMM62710.1 DUF3786 domain-containing protein [Clostridium muellerianum]
MNDIELNDDRQGRVPYEYIQNMFAKEDPVQISQQSGIYYDEENHYFKIKIMGKEYNIKHPQGNMYDLKTQKEISAYTIKTIVLRYLVNSKNVPVFNKDITYKEIPGGLVYYRNFYNRTILKLAKIFGNDLKALEEVTLCVEGTLIKKGDAACRFEFINNVYITFVIWQGDDELEASANILFDGNIQYYFNAEDLAVVGDVAIELLKNKGEIPNWIGLYQKKTKDGYEIN